MREFNIQDVDDAVGIVGDDRVTRWVAFASRSRVETEHMVATTISAASADPRTEYLLAVTPLDSDRVLGLARLALGGVDAAKLGYAIHADH